MALSDFPRYPLLFGPSPIHTLDRLTAHLGGVQSNHTRQLPRAVWRR
jgi:1-aminocyclopropane-1-carboxylate deaminase/D-cysteine desulfhydrase-like pyridoxal-dependent ACC family enzyme